MKRCKGKDAVVVRDIFAKIATWIQIFIEVGDVAVTYDPAHAALPWAGVRFLQEVRYLILDANWNKAFPGFCARHSAICGLYGSGGEKWQNSYLAFELLKSSIKQAKLKQKFSSRNVSYSYMCLCSIT